MYVWRDIWLLNCIPLVRHARLTTDPNVKGRLTLVPSSIARSILARYITTPKGSSPAPTVAATAAEPADSTVSVPGRTGRHLMQSTGNPLDFHSWSNHL
jgi:hypothetical protein